ncbi:MAG TPA: hypothetical protein VGL86_19730 [Polyangia bacterium]|jgi:uncharacterized membrane protein
MRAILLIACVAAAGCGGDDTTSGAGDMATAGSADMSCAPLTDPITTPDGGAGGDTWANYAQGFFATYCTRCHSSTLTGDARNGAPDGYNWDDESSVNAHIADIRDAVGVSDFMPFTPPDPSCSERRRIVRWIDAGGPP